MYGVFYGGIAIFSSLGALSFGYIWQNFEQSDALVFSLVGTITVFLFSLMKSNKEISTNTFEN